MRACGTVLGGAWEGGVGGGSAGVRECGWECEWARSCGWARARCVHGVAHPGRRGELLELFGLPASRVGRGLGRLAGAVVLLGRLKQLKLRDLLRRRRVPPPLQHLPFLRRACAVAVRRARGRGVAGSALDRQLARRAGAVGVRALRGATGRNESSDGTWRVASPPTELRALGRRRALLRIDRFCREALGDGELAHGRAVLGGEDGLGSTVAGGGLGLYLHALAPRRGSTPATG